MAVVGTTATTPPETKLVGVAGMCIYIYIYICVCVCVRNELCAVPMHQVQAGILCIDLLWNIRAQITYLESSVVGPPQAIPFSRVVHQGWEGWNLGGEPLVP